MVKLHELATEFNYKAPEFMKLLTSLGFNYTSFAQTVVEAQAAEIRTEVTKYQAGDKTRATIHDLSLMTMLGVYYCYQTGKYHIASIRLYPEEFDKHGIILSKPYPTIDHATQDLNKEMIDADFFSPGQLEKFRRKQIKENK